MSRTYIHTMPDGSPSRPLGLTHTMVAAARRIVAGHGPFTLTRSDWYKHPELHRLEMLRMLKKMLPTLHYDEFVNIRDHTSKATHDVHTGVDGNIVFHVKRAQPEPKYKNPLRDCIGLRPLREDMGVDYSVSAVSPVYAVGPGVVTIYRTSTGWPWTSQSGGGGQYIAYKLTDGPAKGLFIYDAEHIVLNPKLKVGDKVDADTVIAHHQPGFANCEMGWAKPSDNGYTPVAYGTYSEGQRTAAGVNFDAFMVALGAPKGLTEGRGISGSAIGLPSAASWGSKV